MEGGSCKYLSVINMLDTLGQGSAVDGFINERDEIGNG